MTETKWELTTNRFVVLLDILGFKDLVARSTHDKILNKLIVLKTNLEKLENPEGISVLNDLNFDHDQTKSFTFSDTIMLFSKGSTYNDALKIIFDANRTIRIATDNEIAIKGAMSFGKLTVNFEKSLFYGQPIIDAYLLHEELQMLTMILDNEAESKLSVLDEENALEASIVSFKANLKSGRITHKLLKPSTSSAVAKRIKSLRKLYESTYGRPRIYIDNTLEFLDSVNKVKEKIKQCQICPKIFNHISVLVFQGFSNVDGLNQNW